MAYRETKVGTREKHDLKLWTVKEGGSEHDKGAVSYSPHYEQIQIHGSDRPHQFITIKAEEQYLRNLREAVNEICRIKGI